MKEILSLTIICMLILPGESIAMHKKKKKTAVAQNSSPSLDGNWKLTYLEGADIKVLYAERIPDVYFDTKSKKVSGNNGCNSFSGAILLDGNRLSLPGPLAMTRMFCAGEGEQVFMDALNKVSSFSFHGPDELDLIRGDIGVMRLQRK